MNDKIKKIVYSLIIAACIGVSAWAIITLTGSPDVDTDLAMPVIERQPVKAFDIRQPEFAPPSVFPSNSKYQKDVLRQMEFFNDYELIVLSPEEFNKDNPFGNY
jgi:hypothetical protein